MCEGGIDCLCFATTTEFLSAGASDRDENC